jgi:hypothetical protein
LDKYYTSALAREDVAGYRKNDSRWRFQRTVVMLKLESFYDFFFFPENEFIKCIVFNDLHPIHL